MKQGKSIRKHKKPIVIIVIIVVCLLAFDLTPFGGTMKFYAEWISCRQKPVVTHGSGYFNDHAAYYSEPSTVSIFPGNQQYFCTPYEAEKAGYSASKDSYSFPHLKPDENPFWREYKNSSRPNQ